ncbi:MAG TPA: DinB family protein [Chitinophagales bacterium]|nr:DinB family protein [Chitinophagales bacterium]
MAQKKDKYDVPDTDVAVLELEKMMAYTLQTMEDKWNLSYEDVINNQMKTAWGQQYDFEQLLEHAIVHVMRHKRQIERLLKLG